MKAQRSATDSEDLRAARVQHASSHHPGDVEPGLEARVDLDQRLGPEAPARIGGGNLCVEVRGTDAGEGPGEALVAGDDLAA